MYLYLNCVPADVLGALEDVEHAWLIKLRVLVIEVLLDKTGLSHRGVADEHEFQFLFSVAIL